MIASTCNDGNTGAKSGGSGRFSIDLAGDFRRLAGAWKNGAVESEGTHEALLQQGGRYAELFELQAAGYR